jgi:hypothetical protein
MVPESLGSHSSRTMGVLLWQLGCKNEDTKDLLKR